MNTHEMIYLHENTYVQHVDTKVLNDQAKLNSKNKHSPNVEDILPCSSFIPEGLYISKIVQVCAVEDANGCCSSVEIEYLLDDGKNHFTLWQIYRINSRAYVDFTEAMYAAGLTKGSEMADLYGVCEVVLMGYHGGSPVIKLRMPNVTGTVEKVKLARYYC